MNLYDLIFYLFAAVTILSAAVVVSSKNIIYSAFSLVLTFFGVAGLYILLGADFIGIVQILVYVGGIMILLLFGVMLTNKITSVDIRTGSVNVLPSAIAIGVFMGLVTSIMLWTNWVSLPTVTPLTTTNELGKLLITEYVLIFELLGILLLVALIGAASIARRDKE
jgi:NADH-quinone oxidoreductase subunit J